MLLAARSESHPKKRTAMAVILLQKERKGKLRLVEANLVS
jgi:hypothetical protein